VIETAALCAAYTAGLATRHWTSTGDIRANWGVDKRWHPQMKAAEREKLYAGWNKGVAFLRLG
jgi:glycerol kinase